MALRLLTSGRPRLGRWRKGALDAIARGWALSKGRRIAFVVALFVMAVVVGFVGDQVVRLVHAFAPARGVGSVGADLLASSARVIVETVLSGCVAIVPAVLYGMIRELRIESELLVRPSEGAAR